MGNVPNVTVGEIVQMCMNWSNRINVRYVRIIGGEPLLHPDIEEITRVVIRTWKECKPDHRSIEIVTNGFAIRTMKQSFLRLLGDNNVLLRVSLHKKECEVELKELFRGIKIPVLFVNSYNFERYYLYEGGKPVLHHSNKEEAHRTCYARKRCHVLMDNVLYRCSPIPYFRKAHLHGIINDARVMAIKPATLDMSIRQLQEWYEMEQPELCGCCSDNHSFIPYEHKYSR